MSTKVLGKIKSVRVGDGGYQDAQFGVSFTLESKGSGCGDFWGAWGPGIEHSAHCKWTEVERQAGIAKTFWRLAKLMQQAKVNDTNKLAGIPIEIEYDNNCLKSWRVLDEVL